MCERCDEQVEPAPVERRPTRRRKLWELCSSLHCSIVGTCLTMDDLYSLLRRARLKVPPDSTDYAIHGLAVRASSETQVAPGLAKLMHKTMEKRYAGTIRRAKSCDDAEALKSFWALMKEDGQIAGAYWAVLTHPLCDEETAHEIHGDIHMMSHLQGAGWRSDIKRLTDTVQDNKTLKAKIDTMAARHELAQRQWERERVQLHRDLTQNAGLQRRLDSAEKQLAEWQSGAHQQLLEEQVEDLMRTVARQASQIAELQGALKAAETRHVEMPEQSHAAPVVEPISLQSEEPRLDGQAILYVGGRTNLLPQYRDAVQAAGASFDHHDGGQENNMDRLGRVIGQADCVLCPVDCVSHNACLKIKALCRKNGKDIRFLRTASISALNKELQTLSAAEA